MYLALGSFPERDARERILCFCVVVLCLRGLSGKDCLSLEACSLVHHVHPEKGLREALSVGFLLFIYFFTSVYSLGIKRSSCEEGNSAVLWSASWCLSGKSCLRPIF